MNEILIGVVSGIIVLILGAFFIEPSRDWVFGLFNKQILIFTDSTQNRQFQGSTRDLIYATLSKDIFFTIYNGSSESNRIDSISGNIDLSDNKMIESVSNMVFDTHLPWIIDGKKEIQIKIGVSYKIKREELKILNTNNKKFKIDFTFTDKNKKKYNLTINDLVFSKIDR